MRVSKIKNTSGSNITIEHPAGGKFMLTPGSEAQNVCVSNLHEVLGKVKVTHDLAEVTEVPAGKTRING